MGLCPYPKNIIIVTYLDDLGDSRPILVYIPPIVSAVNIASSKTPFRRVYEGWHLIALWNLRYSLLIRCPYDGTVV